MALDRCYIDTSDVKIIEPAIHYYERKGTDEDRMVTYYYTGRIYQNAGDIPNAILFFSLAEEASTNSTDYNIKKLICNLLSIVYYNIYNSEKSYDYALKSEYYSKLALDPKGILRSRRMQALAFEAMGDYSKCRSILHDIVTSSEIADTTTLIKAKFDYARVLARGEEEERNYQSSYDLYRQLIPKYSTFASFSDYATYAYAAEFTGNSALSDELLNTLRQLSAGEGKDIAVLNNVELVVRLHQKKYDGLSEILEELVTFVNRKVSGELSQSYSDRINEYYKLQALQIQQEKDKQRAKYFYALFICVATAFCLIIRYMCDKVKWQRRLNLVYCQYNLIKSELDGVKKEKESAVGQIKEECLHLLEEDFKRINDLAVATNYENEEKKSMAIERIIKERLSVFGESKETREKLEAIINHNYDNVLVKWKEDFPKARDVELRFVTFLVMNLSLPVVASLLAISTDSVYIKKNRLKKKVLGSASPNVGLYCKVLHLPGSDGIIN